jgi:hypothetical protein
MSTRPAVRVLLILLAVDAILIALHMGVVTGTLSEPRFAITTERGFAEVVQYGKAACAALLLLEMVRKTRSLTALVWSAGLSAILLDDAFALHEQLGAALGPQVFPSGFGRLSPPHTAELLVLSGGAVLFALSAAAAAGHEGARGWSINAALGGSLLLLAAFGIGVDALHSMADGRLARRFLAVVEDGGEMAAMSVLTAMTWALAVHARASPWARAAFRAQRDSGISGGFGSVPTDAASRLAPRSRRPQGPTMTP